MNGVMIITGGSRGIGAATARLGASRGYAVAINYRSAGDAAEILAKEIKDTGGKATAIQADVANEADVIRLFDTTAADLGSVTALVNNAGILEQQMPLVDMSVDRVDRIFATNVRGAFLCLREAVRRMSTAKGGQGGAIVNVSSRAALLGAPNEYIDYAATKGALDSMTIGLSKEVAGEGIRVNGVRPGFIKTEMHASGGEPGRVDRVKSGVPLQRGGEPEEVAESILWLLSDAASYSTGTFIDVSGGR